MLTEDAWHFKIKKRTVAWLLMLSTYSGITVLAETHNESGWLLVAFIAFIMGGVCRELWSDKKEIDT